MGSCYSRQASRKACDYATVPMDCNKMEVRSARPTPYSRNQTGTPTNFKRRIPVPAKFVVPKPEDDEEKCNIANPTTIQDLTLQASPDEEKTTPSGLVRSNSSNGETYSEQELKFKGANGSLNVDPNSNVLKEKKQILNNNVVPEDDSPEKTDCSAKTGFTTAVTNVSIIPKYVPFIKKAEDNLNANSNSCDSASRCADAVYSLSKTPCSSRIPAKFTTHIANLPRPQVPQLSDKSFLTSYPTAVPKHFCNHNDTQYAKPKPLPSQEQGDMAIPKSTKEEDAEKNQIKCRVPKLVSKTRGSGDSNESINFDVDSGIGNSLSDKGGICEDAATLKDFEQTLSHEGSPVFPCNVQNRQNGTPSDSFKQGGRSSDSSKKEDTSNQDRKYGIPVLLQRPSSAKPSTESYLASPKSYISRRSSDAYSTGTGHLSSATWHERRKFFGDLARSSLSPSVSKNVTSVYSKYISKQSSYSSPKLHSQTGSNIPVNLSRSIPSILSSTRHRYSHSSEKPLQRIRDPVLGMDNGAASPPSEMENREFLIDDEISDQPSLITFENVDIPDDALTSLQQSLNELHALQAVKVDLDFPPSHHRRCSERNGTLLGSHDSSSSSSLGSDDLMLDFDKSCERRPSELDDSISSPTTQDWLRRHRLSSDSSEGAKTFSSLTMQERRVRSLSIPLRPPRQMVVSDGGDGCVRLDASSYRLLCQDLNGAKTLLLRLKRVLEEAETLNPFEGSKGINACYSFLALNDTPKGPCFAPKLDGSSANGDDNILTQENADLRRQVVYLQQQLKERDNTIKLLEHQVTNYLRVSNPSESTKINAATQTERPASHTSHHAQVSSDEEEPSSTIVSSKEPCSHEAASCAETDRSRPSPKASAEPSKHALLQHQQM